MDSVVCLYNHLQIESNHMSLRRIGFFFNKIDRKLSFHSDTVIVKNKMVEEAKKLAAFAAIDDHLKVLFCFVFVTLKNP